MCKIGPCYNNPSLQASCKVSLKISSYIGSTSLYLVAAHSLPRKGFRPMNMGNTSQVFFGLFPHIIWAVTSKMLSGQYQNDLFATVLYFDPIERVGSPGQQDSSIFIPLTASGRYIVLKKRWVNHISSVGWTKLGGPAEYAQFTTFGWCGWHGPKATYLSFGRYRPKLYGTSIQGLR